MTASQRWFNDQGLPTEQHIDQMKKWGDYRTLNKGCRRLHSKNYERCTNDEIIEVICNRTCEGICRIQFGHRLAECTAEELLRLRVLFRQHLIDSAAKPATGNVIPFKLR